MAKMMGGKYYRLTISTPVELPDPESKPEICGKTGYMELPVNDLNHCRCKRFACNTFVEKSAKCTGNYVYIYQTLKILSVIFLTVISVIDFIKSTTAKDDESMKKNIKNFKIRLIVIVCFIFLPTLINLLLGLVSGGKWSTCGIK